MVVKQIFQWIMVMSLFTTVSADNKTTSPNNNTKVSGVLTMISGVILAKYLPDKSPQKAVVENNGEKVSPLQYCSKEQLDKEIPLKNQIFINISSQSNCKNNYTVVRRHGYSVDTIQDNIKIKEKTFEMYYCSISRSKIINNNCLQALEDGVISQNSRNVSLNTKSKEQTILKNSPLIGNSNKVVVNDSNKTIVPANGNEAKRLKDGKFIKRNTISLDASSVDCGFGNQNDGDLKSLTATKDGSSFFNGNPIRNDYLLDQLYRWKSVLMKSLSMDTFFYGMDWIQSNWLPMKVNNTSDPSNIIPMAPLSHENKIQTCPAPIPQC